jgi:hypothetical protein
MKQKHCELAEVQVDVPRHHLTSDGIGADKLFTVCLPEGATVSVPAGFDADEVFMLLTVVREAMR